MTALNSEIAAKFYELADLLEIDGANPFRVRAYRNAARLIENLPYEAADLIAEGKDLTELPGIGEALAEKIETIVQSGELPLLQETRKKIPIALSDMMQIPKLGPKRIKQLYERLKIKNIADLKKAAAKGKISKLPGFGEKTQSKINAALQTFTGAEKKIKLVLAEKIVNPLLVYLQKFPGVQNVIVAGSYRRRKESIGDLDILVISEKDAPSLMQYFVSYPESKEIIAQGKTRSTIKLRSKIQVDLRLIEKESYGAALQYFTGSKDHNVILRNIAVKKKLKLNEYGLFKGKKRIAGATEEEVYRQLGLPYIEPELRENRGEIAAAAAGKLPKLVTLGDIKGDLHCHSNYSADAIGSLEQMARAAQEFGLSYIAITDHTKHVTIAKGLDKKRLTAQIKAIDKLNAKLKGFQILKSSECDILADGSLDLPNDILKELDLVVCSIHYKFDLPRQKQTERILRAMDNPYFTILGHPTGRLIERRESYDIDLEKIMHAAKARNIFLELNAEPERLDLDDVHCLMAKEISVKISIATDAHSPDGFSHMRFGIDQARRGWLEARDVLNTRNLRELMQLLKRK